MVIDIARSLGSDAARTATEQGHGLEYNEAVEFALDSIARAVRAPE
jgi:hypothetical protein